MFFCEEPETFVSVFRTSSLNLRLYSLSLVSHEKYMFQTMKNMCLLFIFSMFSCYFVFEILIHKGFSNTLGKQNCVSTNTLEKNDC